MKTDIYTRSFAGGVVSPQMVGRIDDNRRDSGCAVCANLMVLPEGIVTRRPGLRFVRATRYADKRSRMLPFRYSSTQTQALNFGEAHIRFHTFAGTLLTPTTGVPVWSNVSTYTPGDLVTQGGFTWYAVSAVPANQQPSTNEYGSAPVVAATWVQSTGELETPPPGYTYVGTELPSTATVAAQVYISTLTDGIVGYETVNEAGIPIQVPIYGLVTRYIGYTGTAYVISSGYWYKMPVEYEIPSPYAEADLADIHHTQSGDVMTLVHPKYAPRELRRLGATKWVLSIITYGSTLSAPTIDSVTPTAASSPSDTQVYSYVATNVTDDQLDESIASAAVTATNQLLDTGAFNTITFSGAGRRNVYRLSGGLYGFIGQTTTTTLVDDNIAPDVSRTPPQNQNPFATDWPAAVTYFEQRRGFGGTPNLPQTFWLTKSGTESNLDYSIPIRENDALAVRIAAREASTIRHMVPLGDLIILTSSTEFVSTTPLNATTPNARSTGYVGANNVQPVVVDEDLIFAAARGGRLRGMGYNFSRQRYVSEDISIRASHLFDYNTVVDLAFARAPTQVVWAVSSAGGLIGLTYVPSEEITAFHTHDTYGGVFESICVVAEGDEDILYAVVKRTIDGQTVRYVECLSPRLYATPEEAFFVDCGLTYSGAAATTISGLDHLIGQTVAILADGAVVEPQVVNADGEIELQTAATIVQVGLAITGQLDTLPVAIENAEAFGQGVLKNVNSIVVRVINSGAFLAGPNVTTLQVCPARRTEPYGTPPNKRTQEVDLVLTGDWNDDGSVTILVTDPTPLTVASITKEVQFSD